jgi:Holliday junction resolvasome RuvABC endonuclease subunit
MKRILGFDVSSSTIGYCTLEWNEETNEITFVSAGYLKPIKEGSIIEKIVDTRDKIVKIIIDSKPDYIGVEDIIQFMKGKSTAKTIIMLTTFNRMVCLAAYDYLKKLPSLFNVMSIRHGLKIDKQLPKKEEMSELVAKHLGIKFPYTYIKKGKNKGSIAVESYDTADGIAVALYYYFILSGRITKKKRKK